MPLNIESKTSYYQFDSAGMLIVPGDERSWRDSIGRTVLAWIAYVKPEELSESLEQCLSLWKYTEKTYRYKLIRHIRHYREKSSRDHWSYFIIYRVLSDGITFKWIPKMRGMNNWMKSLTGDKRAERRYYRWAIPGAKLGNWWLKRCRKIGNLKQEWTNQAWIMIRDKPQTFGQWTQKNRTFWQKLWCKIILNTIPAFSLHIKGWQLYVMPESEKKEKLKRILLKRVEKSNILLRLLLGDKTVTHQEVDDFPHMTGFRSGVYLYMTLRDIREMDAVESEFNTYERDLIKKLIQ
jgi:hypothetical protein